MIPSKFIPIARAYRLALSRKVRCRERAGFLCRLPKKIAAHAFVSVRQRAVEPAKVQQIEGVVAAGHSVCSDLLS